MYAFTNEVSYAQSHSFYANAGVSILDQFFEYEDLIFPLHLGKSSYFQTNLRL